MKILFFISLLILGIFYGGVAANAETYGLCIDNRDKRCGAWSVKNCTTPYYIHGNWRNKDRFVICRLIKNRLDDGVNAICNGKAYYGCGVSISSEAQTEAEGSPPEAEGNSPEAEGYSPEAEGNSPEAE